MVSATEIWAARRAKYSAANKGAEGWQRYLEGPHRKTAPPKPKAERPAQLWLTESRKPPTEWAGVDILPKSNGVRSIFHPALGIELSDPAIPRPMYADTPAAARKAIVAILGSRGGKRK